MAGINSSMVEAVANARVRVDIPVDVSPEEFVEELEKALEEAVVLYKLRSRLGSVSPGEVEELINGVKRGIRERVRRLLDETGN